jgi:hypothetical protein
MRHREILTATEKRLCMYCLLRTMTGFVVDRVVLEPILSQWVLRLSPVTVFRPWLYSYFIRSLLTLWSYPLTASLSETSLSLSETYIYIYIYTHIHTHTHTHTHRQKWKVTEIIIFQTHCFLSYEVRSSLKAGRQTDGQTERRNLKFSQWRWWIFKSSGVLPFVVEYTSTFRKIPSYWGCSSSILGLFGLQGRVPTVVRNLSIYLPNTYHEIYMFSK